MAIFRNWPALLLQATELAQAGTVDNWTSLAKELGCPRTTLMQAFQREFDISSFEQLQQDPSEFIDPLKHLPGQKIEFIEEGNTARARSISTRIKTLDQLIEACDVDLDVWQVGSKWGAKAWEGYAKRERTSLQYVDGRATGTIDRGGIETETLWSVWADFVRINPVPIFPTIQPITCNLEFEQPPKPRRDGVLRSLVWADSQIGFRKNIHNAKLEPFHDRRALDIVVQLIAAIQPDRIDGLGDAGDFCMWTDKYARDPEFFFTTRPALCELHWWLAQMRMAAPSIPIALHQGNHEKRVDDYVAVHLKEAHEMRAVDELHLPPSLSVQRLLALHKLGIEWIGDYPDDEDWLNEGVCLSHGDTARAPGNTAKAVVSEADYVQVIGHVHRSEMVIRTIHTREGNKAVFCYCVPCLCHVDGRVPGSNKRDQWQQGVSVIEYEAEGRGRTITTIPIENGRAIWNGQIFEGRDRTEEIRTAFPEWNW
jgi:hypothetical protein